MNYERFEHENPHRARCTVCDEEKEIRIGRICDDCRAKYGKDRQST